MPTDPYDIDVWLSILNQLYPDVGEPVPSKVIAKELGITLSQVRHLQHRGLILAWQVTDMRLRKPPSNYRPLWDEELFGKSLTRNAILEAMDRFGKVGVIFANPAQELPDFVDIEDIIGDEDEDGE